MTKEQLHAIFLLAGIEIQNEYQLANEYSSSDPDPWWLVKTEFGLIKIGWRKRVISISWTDTDVRIDPQANPDYEFHKLPLTSDNITQSPEGIHAWGYPKAIAYLQAFKLRAQQHRYCTSEDGVKDMLQRKARVEAEQTK